MDYLFRHRSIVRMTVEVQPPTPKPEQPPQTQPDPVEEIRLKFVAVVECSHFLVSTNNNFRTTTLTRRHESEKVPLVVHQIPIQILDHGPQSLHQFLSSKFPAYQNDTVFNIHTITDKIIATWAEIKQQQEQNLSVFVGKVLPLTVTLRLWNVVVTRHETPMEDRFMIPTSDFAVEEMLKRVKVEQQFDDDDQIRSCVICLEDISVNMEKEENGEVILLLLQMPCLHVFHEECIKKWLKSSHYCPICRFQMPTDSS
ncbi:uncharacterized protein LOC111004784 [Momordica charantia]|uniref:RING-type E3 ubiquitin transferase n=1 Tax=Momordica charantia TaxID=3673 RepID=A0A6J1BQW1_MOMCH|nr:uncharacterized protein LOC111004784 [Momordica charantia]